MLPILESITAVRAVQKHAWVVLRCKCERLTGNQFRVVVHLSVVSWGRFQLTCPPRMRISGIKKKPNGGTLFNAVTCADCWNVFCQSNLISIKMVDSEVMWIPLTWQNKKQNKTSTLCVEDPAALASLNWRGGSCSPMRTSTAQAYHVRPKRGAIGSIFPFLLLGAVVIRLPTSSLPDTTRDKRSQETEGMDYHFVSVHKFEEDILNRRYMKLQSSDMCVGHSILFICVLRGKGHYSFFFSPPFWLLCLCLAPRERLPLGL